MPEKRQLLTPETREAFYRAFLRVIPIVPGPELFDILASIRHGRESIDAKITQALTALKSASQLIDELERDLNDRTNKLTKLKDEVERYSKLAEVEEGKAKALLQQIDLTLRKGQGRERWISLIINLVAGIIIFIVGMIASPRLTAWWQHLGLTHHESKARAEVPLVPKPAQQPQLTNTSAETSTQTSTVSMPSATTGKTSP